MGRPWIPRVRWEFGEDGEERESGMGDGESGAGEECVEYHVMRCPRCRSEDVIVTGTLRPVRYHECRACGRRFKSLESVD